MKALKVQYHQKLKGAGYITEDCEMEMKSPAVAAAFLFKYVEGIQWVRIDGVVYGKQVVKALVKAKRAKRRVKRKVRKVRVAAKVVRKKRVQRRLNKIFKRGAKKVVRKPRKVKAAKKS